MVGCSIIAGFDVWGSGFVVIVCCCGSCFDLWFVVRLSVWECGFWGFWLVGFGLLGFCVGLGLPF